MSKNTDRVLGHADESDGIEEYDNPLPDWWLGLFFVTIGWAIAYLLAWHVFTDTTQAELYQEEVLAARQQYPGLDAQVSVDMSETNLALGEEVYASQCVSCHAADLSGGIGPNLVDEEWVHGGDFESIRTTINEGVAAKGMPTWGPILGPKKIAAVSSYILSKQGAAPAVKAEPATTDGGEIPPPADEAIAAATDEGADLGQAVFTQHCVACHKADMTGGVGPNLVDDEWIHGGTLDDIRRTIIEGVPAKGMITWKGVLTDEQIEAVATYVHEQNAMQ